jgi:hypothetical protein
MILDQSHQRPLRFAVLENRKYLGCQPNTWSAVLALAFFLSVASLFIGYPLATTSVGAQASLPAARRHPCRLLPAPDGSRLSFNPLAITSGSVPAAPANTGVVTVDFTPGKPANTFIPAKALGAALDGHESGELARMLSRHHVHAMLSAGLKPLSYRLRTELAGEAWHWNPAGHWSDPSRQRGYWTSDSQTSAPISFCYGYRLPHRGNTTDQANNDDYSRLDDGDPSTFWKSNPYLDRHFTGEENARHPQWIVLDLGTEKRINAIRINWAPPFATKFEVQYARFEDPSDLSLNPPGMWRTFSRGVAVGDGKNATIRLSDTPVSTRWVRVLMSESSHTTPQPVKDIREVLGYAVREISVGELDQSGMLHDEIHHVADHKRQTTIYVSSTDPWHGADNIDRRTEQAGFDRVWQSGLTNGLPMLTPVGLLYDTPENAAAEIRYLKSRNITVKRVELGEEPDGQYVTPEDYGALYLQFVAAMRRIDPALQFGGPSFQEIMPPEEPGPYDQGNSIWLKRFLSYLQARGQANDFSFFSFEWYPFDDVCDPLAPQLARAPQLLKDALAQMERNGLPRNIPWIITEYGYSAFAAQAEVDIEGALVNADIVGQFLTLGGEQAYAYGYEPNDVIREADCTAGNNMLFVMNDDGLTRRTSTYWGARLLTESWAQPADALLEVYPANSDVVNRRGRSLVTAYSLRRPNGSWSVLLLNKDPQRDWSVRVQIRDTTTGRVASVSGPLELYQFSRAQYEWSAKAGLPIKSEAPVRDVIDDAAKEIVLPAYSLTVVRGNTFR